MAEVKYRVALYTLGCKVSQYETEAIREEFLRLGFSEVPFEAPADVYVINTCTVTAESDAKSRKVIRRARRMNPHALLMVTGCYSQNAPQEVAAIPGVSYVSGNGGKMKLPEAALALLQEKEAGRQAETPLLSVTDIQTEPFEEMSICAAPRTRAYIKIEDGCECRCTYCAIPDACGHVRSKRPEAVLSEVNALSDGGTKEVVLTGIETASYGRDFGIPFSLIDLLELLETHSHVERIRLGSLTPELIRPDFATRIARLKKPTPHYHLSIQSGSSGVLHRMRRRYNREQALRGIALLREAIPGVMFTADMIVGFPGETEEEFRESLSFAEAVGFLKIHVFTYSKRKGTPAATFPDQVPEEVKHRRAAALSALSDRLTRENLLRVIQEGRPLSVVFETEDTGMWHGHSDSYMEVSVPSTQDLHGQMAWVRPLREEKGVLYGELIENP